MKVLWGLRPMGILDGPVRLPLLITCGPVWKTYGSLAEKWSSYYLVPPKNATGPWVWDIFVFLVLNQFRFAGLHP